MRGVSYCGKCDLADLWCGDCYAIKRGRQPVRRRRPSGAARPLSVGSVDSKEIARVGNSSPVALVVADKGEAWRDRYPLLWAHLTQGRDADGRVRQTSTLLVFLEGGRIKLCLKDRAKNLVAFLSVGGMPEGLGQLEDALAYDSLQWRRSK